MEPKKLEIPISEIFVSYEGEGSKIGTPTLFVRTWGCNVHCRYCDTPESWDTSKHPNLSVQYTVPRLAQKIENMCKRYRVSRVSFTGGEPLLHAEALEVLLDQLCGEYTLNLETSGTIINRHLFSMFDTVSLDLKTPCSKAKISTDIRSIVDLSCSDHIQVKAVIATQADLNWLEANIGLRLKDHFYPPIILTPCIIVDPKWPDINADIRAVNRILTLIRRWNKFYNIQVIPQIHKFISIK